MSLEQYCINKRVLTQSADVTAYEALRAAVAHHVGAVLVQEEGRLVGITTDRDIACRTIGADRDPKQTKLRDVMTPDPVSLPLDATKEQAAQLMRARGVRRVPITDNGRAIGIVTLDDLLMTDAIDVESAGDIIEAQLSSPPSADLPEPEPPATHGESSPSNYSPVSSRTQAHARQTLDRFLGRLRGLLGTTDSEQALTVFNIVVSSLMRRISPEAAADFAAQLPSSIRVLFLDLAAGPDRAITIEAIESKLAERLDLTAEGAAITLRTMAGGLSQLVDAHDVAHLADQLPKDMKALLFPFLQPRTGFVG